MSCNHFIFGMLCMPHLLSGKGKQNSNVANQQLTGLWSLYLGHCLDQFKLN